MIIVLLDVVIVLIVVSVMLLVVMWLDEVGSDDMVGGIRMVGSCVCGCNRGIGMGLLYVFDVMVLLEWLCYCISMIFLAEVGWIVMVVLNCVLVVFIFIVSVKFCRILLVVLLSRCMFIICFFLFM